MWAYIGLLLTCMLDRAQRTGIEIILAGMINIYTYIRAYIHIYIHTYTHTYIYTYIHIHTYTYIHTYCHHTLVVSKVAADHVLEELSTPKCWLLHPSTYHPNSEDGNLQFSARNDTFLPIPVAARSKAPSATARLLGFWFETHGCMDVCLSWMLCFQVEVSASGRSFLQRNLTDCGVFECDREVSKMRRPRSTRGSRAMQKLNKIYNNR